MEWSSLEFTDLDENIFSDTKRTKAWVRVSSRENEKRRNWRLTTISNSLKNLLQRGAIAEVPCGVEKLCFVYDGRKYLCMYIYVYMYSTHTYICILLVKTYIHCIHT